ncbi:MAG: hypothetical protein WC511_01375 [Candidatus Pacearchaeota archaeon]
MNSQFLLEKLESSDEFKKFLKENKDAYLCSGFFVVDLDEKAPENKFHFDFYVPSIKKTFSFELENGIKLVELERNSEAVLEKVSMKNNFDLDKLREKILIEMELKKITNKIQKLIFSLQNVNKKDVLIGTIFLSGLGLIKVDVDLAENIFTNFEKKSLFDMMKVVKGNK